VDRYSWLSTRSSVVRALSFWATPAIRPVTFMRRGACSWFEDLYTLRVLAGNFCEPQSCRWIRQSGLGGIALHTLHHMPSQSASACQFRRQQPAAAPWPDRTTRCSTCVRSHRNTPPVSQATAFLSTSRARSGAFLFMRDGVEPGCRPHNANRCCSAAQPVLPVACSHADSTARACSACGRQTEGPLHLLALLQGYCCEKQVMQCRRRQAWCVLADLNTQISSLLNTPVNGNNCARS
jgi:hypothetical protein